MGANSELHIQLNESIQNTINDYNEGNIQVLDAFVILENERKQLDSHLATIKAFKDEFFYEAAEAAEEHKDGFKGHSIEVRNGGRTYVYKDIPEWKEAEKYKKDIESKYKAMFEAIQKGNPNANISEDGEELPLPTINYRKSSIIIKPKK